MDTASKTAVFDAIVVGSGPGGATVARELSRLGKTVLILERGSDAPVRESLVGFAAVANLVPVSEGLAVGRAFSTGGTTAIYFGVADMPPLQRFLSLGIDLSADLAEAKAELPIAVLSDELMGPQARTVREGALALGYAWEKRAFLVDQTACAAGYVANAKWSARQYVHEAVGRGATLLNETTVSKILVENDVAIGVEYRVKAGRSHDTRRAHAAKIVLAAGALASPVILRDSGMPEVVNRGFYCQPGFSVSGTVPGLKGRDCFVGSMGAQLDDGISLGDANAPRSVYRMFMLGNRRFFRIFFYQRNIAVGVLVDDAPGGTLDDKGRYHKSLSDEDRLKLKKGEAAAVRIIEKSGGRDIQKYSPAAGQCGGMLRIHEHVNVEFETRFANLHVCDGSVIPEEFRSSPTLTLICMGKHLAKRIARTL